MHLDLVLQEDPSMVSNGRRGQMGWNCATELQPWPRLTRQEMGMERQSSETASEKPIGVNMNRGCSCLGGVQPEPA